VAVEEIVERVIRAFWDAIQTMSDVIVDIVRFIVTAVDSVLESLYDRLFAPFVGGIMRALEFVFRVPFDVIEFIGNQMLRPFRFLYGVVSEVYHEIELGVFNVVDSVVRSVYGATVSMFVGVYNAVRSFYVGMRDLTVGYVYGVVSRLRSKLRELVAVNLWFYGCLKAFEGVGATFSLFEAGKAVALCVASVYASSYIGGLIDSLAPPVGSEFPGFVPRVDFPEVTSDMFPGLGVVVSPPARFPVVGLSFMSGVAFADVRVVYSVPAVEGFVLSDSASIGLSDSWVSSVAVGLSLSDSVGIGLGDSWSFGWADVIDLFVGDVVVGVPAVDSVGFVGEVVVGVPVVDNVGFVKDVVVGAPVVDNVGFVKDVVVSAPAVDSVGFAGDVAVGASVVDNVDLLVGEVGV